MEDSLRYWIWLRRHVRPTSAAGRLLLDRYSSPEEIYGLDPTELKKIKGLSKEEVRELSKKDLDESDPILAYCKKQKIRILTVKDPEYPASLSDLSAPPLVLFCWGCVPDFSKMQEFYYVYVKKLLLHCPCYSYFENGLTGSVPDTGFCSLGSTWNNKIPATDHSFEIKRNDKYISIDVTDIFIKPIEKRIQSANGLILKPQKANDGTTVISTGDNYTSPLILEIQYE
jgi:hypothetical protein